jgi:hypothetical protein
MSEILRSPGEGQAGQLAEKIVEGLGLSTPLARASGSYDEALRIVTEVIHTTWFARASGPGSEATRHLRVLQGIYDRASSTSGPLNPNVSESVEEELATLAVAMQAVWVQAGHGAR